MSAQIRAAVAALARLNQHLFIILRRWTRWARRGGDVALITGVAAASRTSSSQQVLGLWFLSSAKHTQQQSGGEATAGPAGAPSLYIPARLRANSLVLPRKRKVLVLDLDETLIHSSTKRLSVDFDVRIEVIIDRQPCVFYVYRRPHSDVFLAQVLYNPSPFGCLTPHGQVSRWFEVVIFTASMEEYASPVIDWLDPKGHISRRFYREVPVSSHHFSVTEKFVAVVCVP